MIKIPKNISFVIKTLEENGYEAYIVGGCVRDCLYKKLPVDYDITTSAQPDMLMKLFPNAIPTGIEYGTVTVILDNEPVEVTTFRAEGSYSDSRHPEGVSFISNIKEDLARRDFTINAMAYNDSVGLVDFFEGKEDLKNKILRTVGAADIRFNEDALRILRLFRFASVLDFEIEENTLNGAIRLKNGLESISRERILAELQKAVIGKGFYKMSSLINSGGLSFLGITHCPDFEVVYKCRENSMLAMFAFLYTSHSDIKDTLHRLKASNNLKNYCTGMRFLIEMEYPETDVEIKKLLAASSIELFRDYLILQRALGRDTGVTLKRLEQIIQNKEPYLISQLDINGQELKSLGLKGEEIGKALEALRHLVIEFPQLNKYEILKNKIK